MIEAPNRLIEPEKVQVEKKPLEAPVLPKHEEIRSAPDDDKPLILIVDDDPVSRILAVHVLKGRQFRVIDVESGVRALQVLDKEPVDAVLMDVIMPGIDGLEISRRVRRHPIPRIRTVPIIGISAHAYAESRQEAIEAGMDDYVTKPFNGQDLIYRIEKLLPMKKPVPKKKINSTDMKTLYNLEFIKSYYENDKPFIHNIITLYSQETPAALQGIRTAIQARDWVKVKNESHKIKTNLMMLGINDSTGYLEKVYIWNLVEMAPGDVEQSFETFYKNISGALIQLKNDLATKGEEI